MERLIRSVPLLGEDGIKRLSSSRVAVFGVGGVGGYAVEALCRQGVGSIDVFDGDTVSVSNLNRQIIATVKTVGMPKAEAMKDRILEINPNCKVSANNVFVSKENIDTIDFSKYDYVIDAIDTVTSKVLLIKKAKESGVMIISSMGTGNKFNPSLFEISDISKTSVCPLARVMRNELKKLGIKNLKVLYSKEEAQKVVADTENNRHAPASLSFVPAVAGLIIAGEVILDIAKERNNKQN